MNILHINSYYTSSLFYKNLYEHQLKSGMNVKVFAPTTGTSKLSFDYGKYTTVSRNHNKFDRMIFHLKHMKIFKDVTRKYDISSIDSIHAHSLFSNGYIALKIKRKFKIPYIVAVRNTDVNIFFKYMIHLRKMGIEILREAETIIFISEPYQDQVLQKYIPMKYRNEILSKTKVIPNGIDDYWLLNKCELVREINRKKIKLVYAGVINKNKNISTTIKACKILIKQGIEIEYYIVGKILDLKEFEEFRKNKFVYYLGVKTKEELIETYRKSDIFVMPSIKETFGLVYAEAMSQGLPVIYSRGQGFDKQFSDGTVGYSVNSYDEKEIAEKIKLIIDNYSVITERCIEMCGKFNWEEVNSQYINIYKNFGEWQ